MRIRSFRAQQKPGPIDRTLREALAIGRSVERRAPHDGLRGRDQESMYIPMQQVESDVYLPAYIDGVNRSATQRVLRNFTCFCQRVDVAVVVEREAEVPITHVQDEITLDSAPARRHLREHVLVVVVRHRERS